MQFFSDMDWPEFLGRPPVADDATLAESAVRDRSVLITGAGGSIGSGLAAVVLAGRPQKLLLLDLSESALYECFRRLSGMPRTQGAEIVPVTGSIGDGRFIAHLLRQHRPELIFHAAAYKHVPLMEQNPFSAIANNSIGTCRLVVATLEEGVSRLILVSTDKAVHPLSVMGASKRVAELVVLSHGTSNDDNVEAGMNVVRLCNVLGTSGSVAAIFQEQAQRGSALTVTAAEAKRYFLAPGEAGRAILRAAASPVRSRVLVPDCGEEFRILDLARHIARKCGAGRDAEVEFTGLRPGEKLREELWSSDETVEAILPDRMRVLRSPAPSMAALTTAMRRLESAIEKFDRCELMDAVGELVPGYKASSAGGSFAAAGIAETAGHSTAPLCGAAPDHNSGAGLAKE
jgi:FlaA1/EpsC-like NDP-sugar epimerase